MTYFVIFGFSLNAAEMGLGLQANEIQFALKLQIPEIVPSDYI
jgi:hypothetical protein